MLEWNKVESSASSKNYIGKRMQFLRTKGVRKVETTNDIIPQCDVALFSGYADRILNFKPLVCVMNIYKHLLDHAMFINKEFVVY